MSQRKHHASTQTRQPTAGVDGFTWEEIEQMAKDSVVTARCIYCQAEVDVEPDAESYDCHECGGAGTVTSPLVKLGLV